MEFCAVDYIFWIENIVSRRKRRIDALVYSLNHLIISPGIFFKEGLDSLFEVYIWIEDVGFDGFS